MSEESNKVADGSRPKRRRVIPTLLLLTISVLLPVLLLEGVLRALPGLISQPVLLEFPKQLRREVAARLGLPLKQARRCISSADRFDQGPELCLAYPDFQWVHTLDAVDRQYGAVEQINQDANGFCNIGSKAGRLHNDVVFIGDSFTWCWTVKPDRTFSSLLENKLDMTTYNLGFPGVGPYEYIEILRRYGLAYKPWLVVMSIYEGNDLRDGERFRKSVAESASKGVAAEHGRPDKRESLASLSKRVLNNSYGLSFISASIEALGKRFFTDDTDFRYSVSAEGETIPMNVLNADRDEVKSARRLRQGKAGPAVWRDALERFVKLSERHGFRPVVAYIPSAHTAYANSVAFEDSVVASDVAHLSETQRDYLGNLAAELGYHFVDLSSHLQQAVAAGPLAYFPGNVHLTARGHALIADALAPILGSLTADDD